MIELEKIRREWVNATRKNGFREGISDLLAHQYSKKTHFIFELLQNAEDAFATEVEFRVENQRLVFSHNGKSLFSDKDVESITSIGKSTKLTNFTQIGKHGIGFKAVLAYTHTPHIHSGNKHFYIEDVVIPCLLTGEDLPCDLKPRETRIILPFDSETMPESSRFRKLVPSEVAKTEISDALKKLNIRTLLFLRHIEEIRWTLFDGTEGVYLRESRSDPEQTSPRYVDVTDGDRTESWLVFEQEINLNDNGKDNECIVEVAFLIENGKVIPAKDTELVVYFPTEKKTGLAFLIQGPFKTTKARDNIKSDDLANQQMLETAAHLAAASLETLRDLNLLEVPSYLALPLSVPLDSFFRPVFDEIRRTLRTKPLLPAHDGIFIKAQEAKLVRGKELINLFSPEQLCLLFGKENLSWLDASITENGVTADLYTYLVGRKERWQRDWLIEPLWGELQVDAEAVASRLTEPFLQEQSDEWLISFYRFIGNQNALWKPTGTLRKKPFIRLNDGSHVKPFREDGSPNVFLTEEVDTEPSLPIVKIKLTQNEEVYKFLKNLGIQDLDLVEEVIEGILPKYSTNLIEISINENTEDIRKIEHAFTTNSQEKRKRLREHLYSTYFIIAENLCGAGFIYHKPGEVYFGSDKLKNYFYGNTSTFFVSPKYPKEIFSFLKDLGVSDSIRINCKAKHNSKDYVKIDDHRRGLNGFDPEIEVDGIENALINPSNKRSEFIWNEIAIKYSHCIKGTVVTSSRQDFSPDGSYYKEDEITSKFGHILTDTEWLPSLEAGFVKPSELVLEDLPDSFIRDAKLADQLGMKKNDIAKLADAAGISTEVIKFMQQNLDKIKQLMDNISAKEQEPSFPKSKVEDPDRRSEKLTDQINDAPDKEYKHKNRSVRITAGKVDPIPWLRNQYTNDEGQLICQICKTDKSFKRRDGEYHFEKKEAFSEDYFTKEHEAQYLALCPRCAAMYNHFVTKDKDVMELLKNALVNSEEAEIPLQLGELDTSLRFVETHFHDIKTILETTREQ
ncbi:MAG: hypothetical protein PF440_11315 [Thiomicrorhabdus sp.]|nr:hypothetical protein [Thiomicrorhabdus sp.]